MIDSHFFLIIQIFEQYYNFLFAYFTKKKYIETNLIRHLSISIELINFAKLHIIQYPYELKSIFCIILFIKHFGSKKRRK